MGDNFSPDKNCNRIVKRLDKVLGSSPPRVLGSDTHPDPLIPKSGMMLVSVERNVDKITAQVFLKISLILKITNVS